jgi:hypothetical protein
LHSLEQIFYGKISTAGAVIHFLGSESRVASAILQFEPNFRWLASQQDPVKIWLEMIAQWSKYCFGAKSRHIVLMFTCICLN